MASAREVAEWMVKQLDQTDYLYQETVVCEIAEQFGDEFTYTNNQGGYSISREVLKAFRTLTEDTAVWERGERLWRKREPYDPPGRQQD